MTGMDDEFVSERCEAFLKSAIISETDIDGKIVYVNDDFVKTLGYSRKEIIGKNHRVLNSGRHNPEFFRDIFKTVSKGKVWKGVIENFTKNGERIWLDTTIVPILDKKGNPLRYLAVRFDVSRFMGR